jgi:hypothetical protein
MELVLQESAVDTISFAQRVKSGGRHYLGHGTGTPAQTDPVGELLRLGQPEAVKEVKIKGVAIFSEIGADDRVTRMPGSKYPIGW